MIITIARIVDLVFRILMLVIVVDAVLSFFMSPYHPVRETLGRILNPLYSPIRRIIRPIGGLDFTPLILLLIIQVLSRLIVGALLNMA